MAKAVRNAVGVNQITIGGTIVPQIGDLVGYNGTNFQFADADANPVIPAQFMCMEPANGADTNGDAVCNVCTAGILYDSTAPFILGANQYLTTTGTTGNTYGATMPVASTTLTILQRIGVAMATDIMAFRLHDGYGPIVMRANVTYDPASLANVLARGDTLALTGVLTTDLIQGTIVNGNAAILGVGWSTGLLIASIDVVSANNIRVNLVNPTAGALDGASITLTVLVNRF